MRALDLHTPSFTSPASRAVIKVLIGSLVIAICAQMRIPFWPVPMTMQPFAIMLVGLLYSPSLAFATVLVYLFEGAIGLPVFAGMSYGINVLSGTTGGYLLGFLVASTLISALKPRVPNNNAYLFLACLAGEVALYTLGLSWLSVFIGWDKALEYGLAPFLLKVPVSCMLAVVSSVSIRESSLSRYL
jgi:biotin transport system substrate-specific component